MQLFLDYNLKKRPYTHYYSQNTTSKTPIYTQLLLDYNLKKRPSTYNYSQITTSKNTHLHATTPRSQPQKTPIYIQLLLDYDLKRYTFEEYKHKKVGINHHSVYPHLYYFSRLITKTNQKVRCFTLRKQQPNG